MPKDCDGVELLEGDTVECISGLLNEDTMVPHSGGRYTVDKRTREKYDETISLKELPSSAKYGVQQYYTSTRFKLASRPIQVGQYFKSPDGVSLYCVSMVAPLDKAFTHYAAQYLRNRQRWSDALHQHVQFPGGWKLCDLPAGVPPYPVIVGDGSNMKATLPTTPAEIFEQRSRAVIDSYDHGDQQIKELAALILATFDTGAPLALEAISCWFDPFTDGNMPDSIIKAFPKALFAYEKSTHNEYKFFGGLLVELRKQAVTRFRLLDFPMRLHLANIAARRKGFDGLAHRVDVESRHPFGIADDRMHVRAALYQHYLWMKSENYKFELSQVM